MRVFKEILSGIFCKMFGNIGGKIKTLAKVVCIAGMVLSLINAIRIWNMGNTLHQDTTLTGLLWLILGCLGSWIGSFFTYGFGELIERTCSIDDKLNEATPEKDDSDRKMDPIETWICPNCRTVNPKSKIECHECGTLKK